MLYVGKVNKLELELMVKDSKTSNNKQFTFANGNIWGGRLSYGIIRALGILKPDIMNVQEVYSGKYSMGEPYLTLEMMTKGKLMKLTENGDVQEDRQTTLFFDDFVKSEPMKEWDMNLFGQKNTFHNATLVKNPWTIESSEIVSVGNRPNRYGGKYYDAMVTKITGYGNVKINVVCYHGEVIRGIQTREGHPVTDKNGEDLAKIINNLEGPTILSADFNVYPDSSSIRAITDNCRLKSLNSTVDFKIINDDRLRGGRVKHGRGPYTWMEGHEIVTDIMVSDDFVVDEYIIPPHPQQVLEQLQENLSEIVTKLENKNNIDKELVNKMISDAVKTSEAKNPYLMALPSDHKFHAAKLRLR